MTFSPPWLFRTPPGWDLYLKGPSNRWKPNCHPLEGIIETWWLNYTFTINWKLVEPGTVVFARGESLGQLVPVPHATFEGAAAVEAPIGLLEPEAARELLDWLQPAPAARRPEEERPPPLPQGRGRRRPPPQGRRAGGPFDPAVRSEWERSMSRRTAITMIRITLAIAGIVTLVTPIQSEVNSSAFYKGKVMGTAAIALALLVTAIP